MKREHLRAFTLVELLIVVAIVAVLAAIAMPNFFEAQVRAKVVRALADMRTIATALEAYHVDRDAYPPAATYCMSRMDRLEAYNSLSPELTTPVAYLSALPEDRFNNRELYKYITPGPGFANGNASILAIWVPEHFPNDTGKSDDVPWFDQATAPVKYGLWSVGPWGALSVFDSDASHVPAPRRCWYDPTNGTRSWGAVVRLSTGHTAPSY